MSKYVSEAGLTRLLSKIKEYFAPAEKVVELEDKTTELEGRVATIEEDGGVDVVQTTGNSENAVMSQKAVTEAINNIDIPEIPEIPEVPTVVQTTGNSETAVMSQKAVTEAINNIDIPEIPEIPEVPTVVQTTGDSETAVMSQKAVTVDFDNIYRTSLEWIEVTPVYNRYAGTSYIKPSGYFGPLSKFSVSDPIEIPENVKQLCFTGVTAQPYIMSVAFFDSDELTEASGALGGYICHNKASEYVYVDIPDGATYFYTCKSDAQDLDNARYYFVRDIEGLVEDIASNKKVCDVSRIASAMVFNSCEAVAEEPVGLYGDSYYPYVTSTFSGWKAGGFVYDTDRAVKSITIPIKARDTVITQISFILEVGDKQYIKTMNVDVEAQTQQNITCDFENPIIIAAGKSVSVGYACNQFCDAVIQNSTKLCTLWYKVAGNMDVLTWTKVSAESKQTLLFYMNTLIIPKPEKRENRTILHLPQKYDLIVGDNFELFYKGVFDALSLEGFDFEVSINTGNHGYAFERKYVWTPTASNVGQHTMTIIVRDNNGDVVDEGSVVLNVVDQPTSPQNNKVVLCVGDSLTQGGAWCAEFYRRLTTSDGSPIGYGLENIQFIGDRTRNNAEYIGNGGWGFSSYNEEHKNGMRYYIYGVFNKTSDDQHSVYADSVGNTWKLETITSDSIKIVLVSGTQNTLPATGILTHVSGGVNTDDITYTSHKLEAGNPLWNSTTGSVDFAWYAEQSGVTSIDYCNVLLGWNNTTDSEEDYKADVRIFLDNLLFAFPNCKISLLGLQVPSRDGFGQNYGTTWKYHDKLKAMRNICKWYQEIAEEEAYVANVEYVDIAGQFDSEHSAPWDTFPVNNRSTITEKRQTNGVHPSSEGYLQIADAVVRNFVSKLHD